MRVLNTGAKLDLVDLGGQVHSCERGPREVPDEFLLGVAGKAHLESGRLRLMDAPAEAPVAPVAPPVKQPEPKNEDEPKSGKSGKKGKGGRRAGRK